MLTVRPEEWISAPGPMVRLLRLASSTRSRPRLRFSSYFRPEGRISRTSLGSKTSNVPVSRRKSVPFCHRTSVLPRTWSVAGPGDPPMAVNPASAKQPPVTADRELRLRAKR
jgi:hypothetical protein